MIVSLIRNILKLFSFVPALLLMYMIYTFSGQPGEVSSQLSYKASYKIVETVDSTLNANMENWEIDLWVTRIHGLVRKCAHVSEYFLLAIAVSFPLYVYGVHGIWLMLLAGLICVGFAYSDEYHQSFVAGRSPSQRDVMIDSIGVFIGIIIVRIIGWTGRKTIFRPLAKKKKPKAVKEMQETPVYNKKKAKHQSYDFHPSRDMDPDVYEDEVLYQDDFSDVPEPVNYHGEDAVTKPRPILTDEEINELYWNSDAPYRVRNDYRRGEKI